MSLATKTGRSHHLTAILPGDFAALELEPRDFIYADPPYDVDFTQYSKEQFGWDETTAGQVAVFRHALSLDDATSL